MPSTPITIDTSSPARFSRLVREAGPEIDSAIKILKQHSPWLREYAQDLEKDHHDVDLREEFSASDLTPAEVDEINSTSMESIELLRGTAEGFSAAIEAWDRIVSTGFLWQTEDDTE